MAAEPGTAQFSIGRVIGDSFGVYARNFITFTVLAPSSLRPIRGLYSLGENP